MEKLAGIIENVVFVVIGFYIGKLWIGAHIQKKITKLRADIEIWSDARKSKLAEIERILEEIRQGIPKKEKS